MAKTTITRDEWLIALGESAAPLDQDAMTISELAAKYNASRSAIERMIRELSRTGRVLCTRKLVRYPSGQVRRQAAFRLSPVASSRKARRA